MSIFENHNLANKGLLLEAELIKEDPSKIQIKMEGYLDTSNSTLFADTVLGFMEKYGKIKLTVLDLENLTYVSSTGIGAFINILNHTNKKNLKLFFINITEKVKSVFDLLGFSGFFKFIRKIEEAE